MLQQVKDLKVEKSLLLKINNQIEAPRSVFMEGIQFGLPKGRSEWRAFRRIVHVSHGNLHVILGSNFKCRIVFIYAGFR